MPSRSGVKLMSAVAFDKLSFDESGLADPVIRVLGELPATAQPFYVNRVYKGAQGRYEESFVILDPDDTVIYQQPWRFVELRGEMYEDLFRGTVTADFEVASPDQHTMVFLINGIESGRIPVWIDAKESVRTAGVLDKAAETALKKGSIMWLTIPQPDGTTLTRPAWYVQQGAKLFVLKGPGEQELPNLENVDKVEMTVKSKDIKATIGVVPATTRVVDNTSDEFTRIATQGMGTRLNLPDGEGALERWRSTCAMVELTPQY